MNTHRMLMIVLMTAAVCVMSAGVGTAEKMWYVDDDGGEGIDYIKIQQAVSNASEGDTIYVYVGTYVENVDINTRINLIGIGMPVVDANGRGDVIRITADGCIVEGFKVANGDWASGIKVESDGNIIKNNIVSGNCYAIHLLDSSNNEITENKVSNNDFGIHISTTEISTTIGAEGGIIEVINSNSSLHGVKVEIPAGALDDATDIKLRPISQEELEKEMKVCYTGSAYDFLKAIHLDAGGATFKKPINVTIPKLLNVSENGSILVAQIFPDVDNNTKPDLILVDIDSVEGEFIVGSSSVKKGLAQASCLPVPGITQGGTLTFLYQGETIFLTGRVVDSMGSPLGGSIVTSLQSGGIKAISRANGEYALNAALYGPGQQTINFVACKHILNLLGTNNISINPSCVLIEKIVSVGDTKVSKTKEEVEAEMGAQVLDGICEEPLGQALMAAFFESCMDVAIDATDRCVSNHLTESEYSFHPNEMGLHVGESGTFEVDCSSIVGSDVPIPPCPHVAIWPLICDANIKLNMEIPAGTVTTLTIDASVEDENIATIVGTENPTLEDRTLRVVVRGEDEGTTNLSGKITKYSASYSIKFSSGADETICENAKSAPNIDCGNTSIRPAAINVNCFPEDHFGDAEYEDSNHDWDGDGELDGTDKNGDTYGDKQITWHAGRTHVVCDDFLINYNGYTLTIEPGAVVTFVKGATLEAEDDAGVLIAEGTEDQKIIFREFGGGDFSPNYFYSPPSLSIKSDGSRFSYCSVKRGVEVHIAYNDLEISHCDFSHPAIDIECGSPTITENTFCDGGCVDIHDDDAQITGNTFEGSDIMIRPDVGSPSIARNNFNGSSISAWGGSPTITENSISGSGYDGIWVSHSSSPTITKNSFTGNGIRVDSSSSPAITENSFTGNGIDVFHGSSPTITGNTISGNGGCGIYASEYASPFITGNDIYGNGEDCFACGGEDQDPCECWECIHGVTSEADAGYANTVNADWKFISVVGDPRSIAEIGVDNILGKGAMCNSGCISSMSSSSNNIIYLNTFMNNGCNAVSSESTNIWNSTEKITYIHNGRTYLNYIGNYWDDYAGDDLNNGLDQDQPGSDGIGDTPYNISGGAGAQDQYPLMQPWDVGGSEFISIGSANAPPNSTVTIPVSVANVTNISSISFDLLYNSSVVIVNNVSANESFTDSSITLNIDNLNGTIGIMLTNSNLISTSTKTPVIDIAFNITGGSGSSTTLDLQNVEFSESGFNPYTPAVVIDGQIIVGIKGDFNGNGRVDIGDAAKVAFMVAEKVPEDLNADFNGNGRVDIGDAAKIAFYLAGKVSEL